MDSLTTPDMARPGLLTVFTAGCVAGAAQLSLAVPVDLVKVRLQAGARSSQYRSHFTASYCLHSDV